MASTRKPKSVIRKTRRTPGRSVGSKLGKMEQVSLREAWRHESNEFTPWLAQTENLNALAEALDLDELTCIATEYSIGSFKLDILCAEGEDQVIIENQLEETDHRHLGQILAYAAGVGAKKIIWVADSFRPEHASALEYLNANTTDELAFFGVKVELWKIGNSPLAPKFEVVVRPDNWAKAGRMQARSAADSSPRQLLLLKFWTALVTHVNLHAPHIRINKPRPQHWLTGSIGRTGFELNCTAKTRHNRLGVEVYLPGTLAKRNFETLLKKKRRIETSLGFDLDWQELPHRTASRIGTWFEDASLEDESRWPEYINWMTIKLIKMDKVFRPIIQSIP